MNTDIETMRIILAAQNAGSGAAGIYSNLAPAIYAAGFVVLLIIGISILAGIFDHFTEK